MIIRFIVLDSRPEEVERLLDWADPLLDSSSLDETSSNHLRSALVEVVNNCIRHAYGLEAGHPVEIRLELEADRVNAVVRDRGPTFALPGTAKPSELMAQSGRGLEIIRGWVDHLEYERAEGWNICRLSQKVNGV